MDAGISQPEKQQSQQQIWGQQPYINSNRNDDMKSYTQSEKETNEEQMLRPSNEKDQYQGLRGQNSLFNSQSIPGSDYASKGFQTPEQLNMDSSGGNRFSMSKQMPFPPQGSNPISPNENQSNHHTTDVQKSAIGLDCANFGGPSLESDYAEIVYW